MIVDAMTIWGWTDVYGGCEYRLDEAIYKKMLELIKLTNKIAKKGNSTRKSIWVKVPYASQKYTWKNIVFRGDIYKEDDIWYDIEIDGNQVFSYDNGRCKGVFLDDNDMLDWLIETVSKVLIMAQNGEYEAYTSDIPYYKRKGVIRRTDYYAIVPEAREKFATTLSKSEIEELLASKGTTNSYEEAMTARRFYEACLTVYKALGIEYSKNTVLRYWSDSEEEKSKYEGPTPKEWYYAVADGRDDGLYMVPLDDADYYAGWIRRKEPYFTHEYLGGHASDIINEYSYDFSLHVEPDWDSDKCKLVVIGDSAGRSTDLIRAFLALRKAGYAVELRGYEVLVNRLLEKDYLSVVEEERCSYTGTTIAGHYARDEVSLSEICDKDVLDKIVQATEWDKPDEVKLVSKY